MRKVYTRHKQSGAQEPYFDCVTAFANIYRADWEARGFIGSYHPDEILFAEDIATPEKLRAKLLTWIKRKAGRRLPCSPEALHSVREALGYSEILKKHNRRAPVIPSTLGALIDAAELHQKRFSPEQLELAEKEFDGRSQIVRGVAGSGKTAVLVKNLANMLDRKRHGTQLRLEEVPAVERVLVVCFNRALVPLLRQMLEAACKDLMHAGVPDYVDIVHLAGLQYRLWERAGKLLRYCQYESGQDKDQGKDIAADYCRQIDGLSEEQRASFDKLLYSTIYVDEGQDLFEEQYEFLMRLLRIDPETGSKNMVVFYDDAQNLYGRPRPTWSDLGIQASGRSSVMRTCHRNPKQILEFAFNVLLGAATEKRVLTREFADSNFLKENGLVEELPDRWLVHFAARTDGEVPSVKLFATRSDELTWVVAHLKWLVEEQGVQPHEILLVCKNPMRLEQDLEREIRRRMPGMPSLHKPYGKDNSDKGKILFQEGTLTLASVHAAKGYDCPVVLLFGADVFEADVESRATFYVAATRAKMRLFVSGLRRAGSLAEEAEAVSAILQMHPESVREEVNVVFEPAFRKGDRVRDRRSRTGTVVEDAQPKPVPGKKGEYQHVRIDFGNAIEEFVWPLAKLRRL